MGWEDNGFAFDKSQGPWGGLGGGGNKPQKPSGDKPGNNGRGGGNNNNNNRKPNFDFEKFFKKPNGGSPMPDIVISAKSVFIILLLLIVGWMMTGFYVVDASEEGIVLRLGKYQRTATEGLRYHLPPPLEKAYIVKKTAINSIQIGYRSSMSQSQATTLRGIQNQNRQQSIRGAETRQPKESLMITGDTNIADVSFVVQWRIKDSFNYLFKVANSTDIMPETIKAVAESAMREVIGRTNFAEAMTTKRAAIENDVQKIIQNVLNTYESGVEIYAVNLNDVQNPEPVMPAFLDVETAKQDRETTINRAIAYENEIVPRARGDVQKIVQDAEAYKQEVISIASGEAARFASVYDEYVKAKDITRKRIYLDTMQQIMAGTDKVIMDTGKGNGVVPYLPLPELKKKQSGADVPQTSRSE